MARFVRVGHDDDVMIADAPQAPQAPQAPEAPIYINDTESESDEKPAPTAPAAAPAAAAPAAAAPSDDAAMTGDTELESEEKRAPAAGGAAGGDKRRKPARPPAETVAENIERLAAAQVRLETAEAGRNAKRIERAKKHVRSAKQDLSASKRRYKQTIAREKKNGKQPVAPTERPKKRQTKAKAAVVLEKAKHNDGVRSYKDVMGAAGARSDAPASSPRPAPPEIQPEPGYEWVWLEQPVDFERETNKCWCGKDYHGGDPPHEDPYHDGVWCQKPIGWKPGDKSDADDEADDEQQDDQQQYDDKRRYTDGEWSAWKDICTCDPDPWMRDCKCGALAQIRPKQTQEDEYSSGSGSESDPSGGSWNARCKWQEECICNGIKRMRQCKCKARPKVLAWWNGKWQKDVQEKLDTKEVKDKLADVSKLDPQALRALKTLTWEVALILLNKVRDDKAPGTNINEFMIKNAGHMRNQWNLGDASSSSSSDNEDEDVDEED